MTRHSTAICLAVALTLLGCESSPDAREEKSADSVADVEDGSQTGSDRNVAGGAVANETTADIPGEAPPSDFLEDHPDWLELADAYEPDPEAVETIAAADDAEIVVYLGTWCSDSRREVSRWLGAVDAVEGGPTIHYVPLDRTMSNVETPETLTNVPTFYVRRDGKELGRVVETAVEPIEVDVADLLSGRRSGFISASVEPPAP